MQELLLRSASFAAWFFATTPGQSTSATCRIPKAILLKDIPALCLTAQFHSLILFQVFQSFLPGFGPCEENGNFGFWQGWFVAENGRCRT
jgi:hypothetical protein